MRATVSIFAVLAIALTVQAEPQVRLAKADSVSETAKGDNNALIPVVYEPANSCTDLHPDSGLLEAAWCYAFAGDTSTGTNDFSGAGFAGEAECSNYGGGARDNVLEFQVDTSGIWNFWTQGYGGWGIPQSSFDTSLGVFTGPTCPATEAAQIAQAWACEDDGAGAPPLENLLTDIYVTMFSDEGPYYLVVDGYGAPDEGAWTLLACLAVPHCTSDEGCDDGQFCTGVETCDFRYGDEGLCSPGSYPCESFQVCEEPDVCINPDPCLAWLGGAGAGWTGTQDPNVCEMFWKCDDIELREGSGRELTSYSFNFQARSYWPDNPELGTELDVDMALFNVHETSCMPTTMIPDSMCSPGGVVTGAGDPPQLKTCAPEGITLPDPVLTGCPGTDFMLCMRSNYRSGFMIAAQEQILGGNAADCVFLCAGVNTTYISSAVFYEDCDDDGNPLGTFDGTWFGDDPEVVPDMFGATVCVNNDAGPCCTMNVAGCEYVSPDDCAGADQVFGGTNNVWDPVLCNDADGDGIDDMCDNCPDDPNPEQEDCNDDGQGDACEDDAEQDEDGDGCCNGVDGCRTDPLKCAPGQCGCGNEDTDSDRDGCANCVDECPVDPTKCEKGCCGCATGEGPCLDTDVDADGYPECAPYCIVEDIDDCPDTCPDVDDAQYGPCPTGTIPTVSEWGLVVLALLLLVAGKVYFGRRTAIG